MPQEDRSRWSRLRAELLRRQTEGDPVRRIDDGVPNNILEVGPDYVVLQSWNVRGTKRTILANEIEDDAIEPYPGKRRIVLTLRDLADQLPSQ